MNTSASTSASTSVLVNGETVPLADPATLLSVVQQTLKVPTDGADGVERGVAVAVNAAVVPRSAWASTTLDDGDSVEILSAVPGG
ncbi:MAG TPA: sulfur carrier protein ThiS [Jiangellaceae bacterium]|nr:sulfur carrier protein ThiS [Jiangellaceae bacterium]HLR96429.1 sulfur carrier protein ThiS [Jiangellaceae bacterium]